MGQLVRAAVILFRIARRELYAVYTATLPCIDAGQVIRYIFLLQLALLSRADVLVCRIRSRSWPAYVIFV